MLRWSASNVAVRHDPAGAIKPDKKRSSERIEGIVALCNALCRAMMRDGAAGRSVYQPAGRGCCERELRFLAGSR